MFSNQSYDEKQLTTFHTYNQLNFSAKTTFFGLKHCHQLGTNIACSINRYLKNVNICKPNNSFFFFRTKHFTMLRTFVRAALLVFSLTSIAQSSRFCRKFNGVMRRGNCECSNYLVNVRNIMDNSEPEYKEYCYENIPLV